MHWDPIPTWLFVLWILWGLQALFGVINVLAFDHRVQTYLQRMADHAKRALKPKPVPSALVVVPIKGVNEHSHSHVFSLLNQQYGRYRAIFVVDSPDDPAFALVKEVLATADRAEGLVEAELLIAGHASISGQKVHNLLRALQHLKDEDEVIVFADADAVPGEKWLARMASGARRERFGAATGYRWFVPDDHALSSILTSVINASVLTMMGPARRNRAWGGSMALRREIMDQSKLIEHWQGALSDDYQLSRAVGSIGQRIFFSPLLVVASPVRYTWRGMYEFGRRQMLITRMYSPYLWGWALMVPLLYCAGWISAAAMAATGSYWGLAMLLGVSVLDVVRGRQRLIIANRLFDKATINRLTHTRLVECFATPLWMGVYLAIVLASAVGNRLVWSGITYAIRSPQDVEVLGRNDQPEA